MVLTPHFRALGRWAPVLVALLGCERPPFTPPGACDTCPYPPTIPPIVNFVTPPPGGRIDRYSIITASATDNKQVTGVEFYWALGFPDNSDWVKLHPGVIPAPPWVVDLSRFQDRLPVDDTFVYLHAVAHDIEGNADTATVNVRYAFVPLPSATGERSAAARIASPPPSSTAPDRLRPPGAARAAPAGPP